jgi:signal transduction histidine kinase
VSHETPLGRRIIAAAAGPVLALLAVFGATVAGVRSSILEVVVGGAAVVAAAVAFGLAARTDTHVGRLLRAIKGVTAESVVTAAAQADGASAVMLSREATSLPDRVGPLSPIASAVVDLRRNAVEAAIHHAKTVRQGFAAPLLRLAQRNQMLLDRQLAYLDGFEDGEVDPDVLERLFKLDQLATEMRRTNEGLMVLTGAAPASFDATPVDLLDVVRGAASGVEAYSRVRTSVTTGTWISGPAANDLSGLLAELIDNACRYSLPDSPVDVRATVTEQGVRIAVRDGGPGMIESRFAELNELLARPPLVDRVPGSAGLGLLIASHLAARLGVSASLRAGSPRGVVATVVVDASLLADRGASTRPLSMGDADGSVPLMVAQLRRRDRLASRQVGEGGAADPDHAPVPGRQLAVTMGAEASQAVDRYFSAFSPAAPPATQADPDALVAGARPAFAPIPPAPIPAVPIRTGPIPTTLPPLPNPAYNASRNPVVAENDRPLFKLADVGAIPSRSLLGQSDDLAAHGLVRRVPRASLERDEFDFDFELDDFVPSEHNAASRDPSDPPQTPDRRSPDEVRRLFADHQEGIRRARLDSPRSERRYRPGSPGGHRP